jgi:hypothetical protein
MEFSGASRKQLPFNSVGKAIVTKLQFFSGLIGRKSMFGICKNVWLIGDFTKSLYILKYGWIIHAYNLLESEKYWKKNTVST